MNSYGSAYHSNGATTATVEKSIGNVKVQLNPKEAVMESIAQQHKAFSEREQIVSSRYKLHGHNNSSAVRPGKQVTQNLRSELAGSLKKEHITSVDLPTTKSGQLQIYAQDGHSKIAMAALAS